MAEEFVTVAQLRAELAGVLARLGKKRGPVYVMQRGQPRAVLVDVDEYRALLEQLEYLDDSLEAMLAHDRWVKGEETSRPLADVIRDMEASAKTPPKKGARTARARVSR